ncbi:MAG TPA: MlaD family protein [Ramlibacter sp.]|uniref:MlaD family protein n=1 Tax=Ramlibacter sp. TaxID=1917967 RepID=UPI002D7E3693|nr:MlaD family protein [Ramlibacter sp.]HET8746072.1 MlaD family protein [Ramlibacter sp.]
MGATSRARWAFALSVVVLAAAGAVAYALTAGRYATYEIRSRDPVSGLLPGAPVEFHGVEVGQVREVQLAGPRSVRVLLSVRKEAPVSTATVATVTGRGLASRGFTGYVYVSLEDGAGPGGPLAVPKDGGHPVIASAPAQTTSLDTSFGELNASVQRVTATLEGLLDQRTVASLKQSIASLEQVTRTLAANNQRIETFLANAERASVRMQPLLQQSDAVLQSLQKRILPEAQQTLVRLDELSGAARERMGSILDHTERASTQLEPLLQSGNETVRALQLQLLPEAQRTLARMEHLSNTLDDTALRIRRNPSVLWRGARPEPAGPGEAQ